MKTLKAEVEKLSPKKGDVLVVTFKDKVSLGQNELGIIEGIKEGIGSVPILAVCGSLDLKLVCGTKLNKVLGETVKALEQLKVEMQHD